MVIARAVFVAGVLLLGLAGNAGAQELELRGAAPVIWTTACPGDGGTCFLTSTSFDYPNPADYTPLATLTLPPGTYLLRGVLGYWTKTPTYIWPEGWSFPLGNLTWGNLECRMGPPAEPGKPDWPGRAAYASGGIKGDEYSLTFMTPVRLNRPTTIQLGCKLWGGYADGSPTTQPVEVGIWNVTVIAERVGFVVRQ